jgi:hypothetical protein
LSFKLHPDDLSFIGANNKPVIDHGDFEVMIGGLKDKFSMRLHGTWLLNTGPSGLSTMSADNHEINNASRQFFS